MYCLPPAMYVIGRPECAAGQIDRRELTARCLVVGDQPRTAAGAAG